MFVILALTILALIVLAVPGALAQQPWQPEEFPIGYWYGPRVTYNNAETWRTVKECNFTFCGAAGGYSVEENNKMLDLCEQQGIPALVMDSRIAWTMVADDDWPDRIGEVVAEYGDHPALYGYYLKDEPNYELFDALGQISREFEKRDPRHLPYINLFPTYASVEQLGTPTYADHLDKFLSITTPRVLSYDHYCLMRKGGIRPDYFENLDLVREYGLKYGIPPWQIILSLSHLAYRDPTAAEMRWQVYTSLVYGMKGIMYFTYWSSESWVQEGQIAIVDHEGKPARLYPIVQQLNGEIKRLGKVLLGLTSTGVYHTGETIPPGCARLGTESVVKVAQDLPLIVGLFKDAQDVQYVMIVNRDYENPVEVSLSFLPHVTGVTHMPATEDEPVQFEDQSADIILPPGDGCLLRLQTAFEYPSPPQVVSTIDFQFNTDGNAEGWARTNQITSPVVRDGLLTATVGRNDPYMTQSFVRVPADTYSKIKVRMRITGGNPEGQLFWGTREEPQFSDEKYLNFPIVPDGEWHEYELPVGEHPKWQGKDIRSLRLDPTTWGTEDSATMQIDWIVGE